MKFMRPEVDWTAANATGQAHAFATNSTLWEMGNK